MTLLENNPKTAGHSAKKIHWQNIAIHGTRTSCKVKLSFEAENNKSFYSIAMNHKDECCQKCLASFKEYVKRKLDSKK